jgi:hypothetical protein
MQRFRWLPAILVLATVVAACGRSDDEVGSTATTAADVAATTAVAPPATGDGTATTAAADKCESEPLTASDVGVTDKDLTVEVMADVGSPLAPGLFQGSIDGVQAWAKYVNANGGLACRQVKVRTWDSKLTPDDTTNGTIDACQNSLAMVGSSALFVLDPSSLATCKDKAGAATGVPDIPERATEIPHQCNPTTFSMAGVAGSCPYSGGVRPSKEMVGPFNYYAKQEPGLHGIFLIPGDLPSAIQSSIMTIRAAEASGAVVNDGEFKVSGSDTQASYGRFVQTIKEKGSTFVYNGSNDVAMVKMRKEAAAQGVDTVKVWACTLACYTSTFLQQGGKDVEGTYVWTPFMPLEEADQVPTLQAYIDGVGGASKTTSWGVGAWGAGLAFQQVVNDIVANDGPNGVTRAKILEGMNKLKTEGFKGDGMYGDGTFPGGPPKCMVIMQVQDGKFVRVWPEAKATLDCEDSNQKEMNLDPTTQFKG